METLGVELCSQHKKRIEKLIKSRKHPMEAIQLYYGLKGGRSNPNVGMVGW